MMTNRKVFCSTKCGHLATCQRDQCKAFSQDLYNYNFHQLPRIQEYSTKQSLNSNYYQQQIFTSQQRERERESYHYALEVDNCLVSPLIMVKNSMCKLRYIMPCIAFTRNIKLSVLVFWKSLQPIHQKHIIICSCYSIPAGIIIRCFI